MRHMKTSILRTAYFLLLTFCPVRAYGFGIEPDDQPQQQEDYPRITCVINTKGYSVHFSAYLQSSADDLLPTEGDMFLPYCQEIPATGKAHFTMDFLDRGVRRLPVAIRVVEESDDDPSEVAPAPKMLVDVPAKIYPTGIIEVQAALNKPGRYAVLLTVDKKDRTGKGQVRIPLQVALGTTWPPLLYIGLAAAIAVALYAAYRRLRAATFS
ncbi:MAG: hypothetical protein ACREV8_07870 [Gammaproteobacteria bacterium]